MALRVDHIVRPQEIAVGGLIQNFRQLPGIFRNDLPGFRAGGAEIQIIGPNPVGVHPEQVFVAGEHVPGQQPLQGVQLIFHGNAGFFQLLNLPAAAGLLQRIHQCLHGEGTGNGNFVDTDVGQTRFLCPLNPTVAEIFVEYHKSF